MGWFTRKHHHTNYKDFGLKLLCLRIGGSNHKSDKTNIKLNIYPLKNEESEKYGYDYKEKHTSLSLIVHNKEKKKFQQNHSRSNSKDLNSRSNSRSVSINVNVSTAHERRVTFNFDDEETVKTIPHKGILKHYDTNDTNVNSSTKEEPNKNLDSRSNSETYLNLNSNSYSNGIVKSNSTSNLDSKSKGRIMSEQEYFSLSQRSTTIQISEKLLSSRAVEDNNRSVDSFANMLSKFEEKFKNSSLTPTAKNKNKNKNLMTGHGSTSKNKRKEDLYLDLDATMFGNYNENHKREKTKLPPSPGIMDINELNLSKLNNIKSQELAAEKFFNASITSIRFKDYVTWLGGDEMQKYAVCAIYVDLFPWCNYDLFDSLKMLNRNLFLGELSIHLKRVVKAFSDSWSKQNESNLFGTTNIAFVISYSLLFLNKNIKAKTQISKHKFIKKIISLCVEYESAIDDNSNNNSSNTLVNFHGHKKDVFKNHPYSLINLSDTNDKEKEFNQFLATMSSMRHVRRSISLKALKRHSSPAGLPSVTINYDNGSSRRVSSLPERMKDDQSKKYQSQISEGNLTPFLSEVRTRTSFISVMSQETGVSTAVSDCAPTTLTSLVGDPSVSDSFSSSSVIARPMGQTGKEKVVNRHSTQLSEMLKKDGSTTSNYYSELVNPLPDQDGIESRPLLFEQRPSNKVIDSNWMRKAKKRLEIYYDLLEAKPLVPATGKRDNRNL